MDKSELSISIIEKELEDMLKREGACLVGFGDTSEIPSIGFPRAVSFAVPIPDDILEEIWDGPTDNYVTYYKRMNARLEKMMKDVQEYLRNLGYEADAFIGTHSVYDKTNYESERPHKMAATRAGLGWIGRCDLLINEDYGGTFRLGAVYTDCPLLASEPINVSRCGECTACVDRCPGHAITGELWTLAAKRDDLVNPKVCNDTMNKMIDFGICGLCFVVCPFTQNRKKVGLSEELYPLDNL